MPELVPEERLQPSLLDRLTDDQPDREQEPRERRILNLKQIRAGVIRDLAWLLNTPALGTAVDLNDYEHIPSSVLNYGMPSLSGSNVTGIDMKTVERRIRQAIVDFEPRIGRGSVRVRVSADQDEMSPNAMIVEIEGQMWAQPVPERLYLKTEVDLESGHVDVRDRTGRGF